MENIKLSLRAGGNVTIGELAHPNRMPFSGLLTYFDTPSNKPVGGAMGKKVIIPSEYGVKSLNSLKGMAVDFDPILMDKHVASHKIGIIDDVWTGDKLEDGSLPVFISGYVFAHDFPTEAADIKEYQSQLGFSYETIDTPVTDGLYDGEPVLIVCGDVVFSGAAILLAEKAAFTQTSLAAQAENTEETEVTELDFEQILAKVIETLETKYTLQAKAEEIVEEVKEVVEEVKEDIKKVTEEVKEVVEEVKEEVKEVVKEVKEEPKEDVKEEVVELKAEAEVKEEVEVVETVDFQTQAADLQASVDRLTKELADLKAEAEEKDKNTHKGFAYPTTLAAKYNLDAAADTYESKIAAVDARTDLAPEQAMALKMELRNAHLKAQK